MSFDTRLRVAAASRAAWHAALLVAAFVTVAPARAANIPTAGEWRQLDAPLPRAEHAAVYDPLRSRMLVIADVELWALSLADSESWSALSASGQPVLYGPEAAYDSLSDQVLVVTPLLDSLYVLDLGSMSWGRAPASGRPFPRYGESLTFDPARRQWVLVGGYDSTYRIDVWVLPIDGPLVWTELPAAGPLPSPRLQHTCTYDPIRDRMIVFGGDSDHGFLSDTWTLELSDSARWTSIPATASSFINRFDHVTLYDQFGDRLITYGGRSHGYPDNDEAGRTILATLDLAAPFAWVSVPAGGPLELHDFTIVIDPVTRRLVRFGGYDVVQECALRDTWEAPLADLEHWSTIGYGTFGPDHTEMAVAFDSRRRRLAIHGGRSPCHNEDIGAILSLLNVAELPFWTYGTPLTRETHVMVYDPVRDRLMIYGGSDENEDRDEVLALDLAVPSTWAVLPASGESPPPTNIRYANVLDTANDRLWIFGGGSRTWYYDVGAGIWGHLDVAGLHPGRGHFVIDPVTGTILLRESATGSMWRWNPDVPEWSMVPTSGTPPIGGFTLVDSLTHALYVITDRVDVLDLENGAWSWLPTSGRFPALRTAAAFDAAARRIVMYGGQNPCNEYTGNCDYHGIWELTFDTVTPTLVSRSVAERIDGAVEVRWETALPPGTDVDIVRRGLGVAWRSIGAASVAARGGVVFSDASAESRERVAYAFRVAGEDDLWGEIWIHAESAPALSLEPPSPNPSSHSTLVRFSVARAGRAELEVVDLQGRRVFRHVIEATEVGTHVITLTSSLAPGVYHVRLIQGGRSVSRRMVRVR
jgi:hypothetical protein